MQPTVNERSIFVTQLPRLDPEELRLDRFGGEAGEFTFKRTPAIEDLGSTKLR